MSNNKTTLSSDELTRKKVEDLRRLNSNLDVRFDVQDSRIKKLQNELEEQKDKQNKLDGIRRVLGLDSNESVVEKIKDMKKQKKEAQQKLEQYDEKRREKLINTIDEGTNYSADELRGWSTDELEEKASFLERINGANVSESEEHTFTNRDDLEVGVESTEQHDNNKVSNPTGSSSNIDPRDLQDGDE